MTSSCFDSLFSCYERFLLDGNYLDRFKIENDGGKELNNWKREGKYNKKRKKDLSEILSDVKRDLKEKLVEMDKRTWEHRRGMVNQLVNELMTGLSRSKKICALLKIKSISELLVGSAGGLGELIYDIGVSWDPLLDVPFIPGSGLKGVARDVAYDFLQDMKHEDREELTSYLFGSSNISIEEGLKGFSGLVTFHDAYPVDSERRGVLVEDIINPHYRPGLETELNVVPTPILHLVVRRGVTFAVPLSVPKRVPDLPDKVFNGLKNLSEKLKVPSTDKIELLALRTACYLLGAAMRRGVGSRSTKGYGRFRLVSIQVGV